MHAEIGIILTTCNVIQSLLRIIGASYAAALRLAALRLDGCSRTVERIIDIF
jgi:hypothetical protein